jgi:hypothetical protein
MTNKRKIEARSRNHCCRLKAIGITYSECVSVVLVIQHALRMRRIILSSVSCPALQHVFPHYLINGTVLEKKLLNTKCVFWFSLQLLSETFLILRRIQPDITTTVHISVCMYSAGYCWQVLMKLEFSRRIFQKSSNIKFHESLSRGNRVVPCGRTDVTKLIVVFRILRVVSKREKEKKQNVAVPRRCFPFWGSVG